MNDKQPAKSESAPRKDATALEQQQSPPGLLLTMQPGETWEAFKARVIASMTKPTNLK